METKRIDFDNPVIPANGKEYKMVRELTITRYKELEKLEIEFYYGFDMESMFQKLKEAWSDLNKPKPADAAVKIYRLMEGVADRVDKREPCVLRICALFLVTEDEDLTTWSEELATQKIEDWQKEGYKIDDFFSLVASLVPGFLKDYNAILQNSFLGEKESDNKEEPSQKKKTK